MAQDNGDVSVGLSNDKENNIVTTSDNEPTGDVCPLAIGSTA